LLGGIAAFGGIGLLVGPLSVTFFMAVTKLYRRDLERGQARAT
jgi:predicted PurR-regulated permease PerM